MTSKRLTNNCVTQPFDKVANAVALATSPVVRALVDPEGAMRDILDLDKVVILCTQLYRSLNKIG